MQQLVCKVAVANVPSRVGSIGGGVWCRGDRRSNDQHYRCMLLQLFQILYSRIAILIAKSWSRRFVCCCLVTYHSACRSMGDNGRASLRSQIGDAAACRIIEIHIYPGTAQGLYSCFFFVSPPLAVRTKSLLAEHIKSACLHIRGSVAELFEWIK